MPRRRAVAKASAARRPATPGDQITQSFGAGMVDPSTAGPATDPVVEGPRGMVRYAPGLC